MGGAVIMRERRYDIKLGNPVEVEYRNITLGCEVHDLFHHHRSGPPRVARQVGFGDQHRTRHRGHRAQAGRPRHARGPAASRSAVCRAARFPPGEGSGRPARRVRLRTHCRQSGAGRLRRPSRVLRVGAGRPRGRHPGDRLGQPDDRPHPGHLLRERVQGRGAHGGRVLSRHPNGVRDRRRELAIPSARAGRRGGAAPDCRLRPRRRMRGRDRVVPRSAGGPDGLRGRGDERRGAGGGHGGAHRGPVLGVRQVRHDPRAAERLLARRDPPRVVPGGRAEFQERRGQGAHRRAAGPAHRRRCPQRGRRRSAARGVRARPVAADRPPVLRVVRGDRGRDARGGRDREAVVRPRSTGCTSTRDRSAPSTARR